MSLPREWNFQTSQNSLFWLPDTESTQNCDDTEKIDIEKYNRPPTTIPVLNFDDVRQQCTPIIKSLLLDEHNTIGGSMFSIQSAPPIPIAEAEKNEINSQLQKDVAAADQLRRPVSLSIEQPTAFPKLIQALQLQTSELEEDDNENLLTVSSLTARPLIAKSREIRNNKKRKNTKKPISTQSELESIDELEPDGGYGWLIVFGAFSVQFWVAGLVKSYGVLYVEIMEMFPHSSAAVASWIPAILSCLCLALAPLSSALCQRFSCRSVVFVGGIFCALGLTLSYFATSLIHLLFTFGVLTGIGGGLSTTPGIIIVSQYFNQHRALANAICISGTAAGSFVFPMLIEHLVRSFGFHGTILILGGCMLHVCVSATLYRPLENNDLTMLSASTMSNYSQRGNSCNDLFAGGGTGGKATSLNTNTTYLSSSEDPINRKFLENLFHEEIIKDKLQDLEAGKKLMVEVKNPSIDSDDEYKDTIGETVFLKPIKSHRSSSILHSVEDLSTDSTFVYKNRTGYDSNRGSRRYKPKPADEVTANAAAPQLTITHPLQSQPSFENVLLNIDDTKSISQSRGLSKSMILPTPATDMSLYDQTFGTKVKKSFCDRIQRYLDITLLKDTEFILMCLSVTLMSTGSPYMLYYLPSYVLSIDFTKPEAGYLVAISAALDLIGRLGLGWLSDLQVFDRKKAYIVCILGAGIAVLMIPFGKSWYIIGTAAGMYGLCLGCWYVLVPVLLADLFGTERIGSSYGLIRMFQSIGAITVPPLAGYLRDVSGGYDICFYSMGACMVMGSIPMLLSLLISQEDTKCDDSDNINEDLQSN